MKHLFNYKPVVIRHARYTHYRSALNLSEIVLQTCFHLHNPKFNLWIFLFFPPLTKIKIKKKKKKNKNAWEFIEWSEGRMMDEKSGKKFTEQPQKRSMSVDKIKRKRVLRSWKNACFYCIKMQCSSSLSRPHTLPRYLSPLLSYPFSPLPSLPSYNGTCTIIGILYPGNEKSFNPAFNAYECKGM